MRVEKPTILFVDDEERILRSLEMAFRVGYRVILANSGQQALQILRETPVDVIVSDQRMPRMSGVEVLKAAKDLSPRTMRILLTGYSDLTGIIGSINEGEIYRYVQKPWRLDELRTTVDEATGLARQSAESGEVADMEVKPGPVAGVVVLDNSSEIFNMLRSERPTLPIRHAVTLDQALGIMERFKAGVLVTDLAAADGGIQDALHVLKQRQPELVVVATTVAADTTNLIRLINETQIYRVLPRPVGRNMLLRSVDAALRHHSLISSKPAMLSRHKVAPKSEETMSRDIISRVRGYLGRIGASLG